MDILTKWFNETTSNAPANLTEMQLFQAGVTKSAVSMRERAMACISIPGMNWKQDDVINYIKNAIGKLPDIPE